ncbi:DUF397 domain-containing protein [Nocardia pseudovaccinii]|uniref:DUF397 domain-containing protein n=1 Tax=Nocardia pseudovaccinii TaxID=189540 RepID=UPI003D9279A7
MANRSDAKRFKNSHSGAHSNCVEIAFRPNTLVSVRDSKDPIRPCAHVHLGGMVGLNCRDNPRRVRPLAVPAWFYSATYHWLAMPQADGTHSLPVGRRGRGPIDMGRRLPGNRPGTQPYGRPR